MIRTIDLSDLPTSLQKIKYPPKKLHVRSENPDAFDEIIKRKRVAIVGTRSVTPYGVEITARLAKELASHGVVIVSGLAIGVDAIAHKAALDAKGSCLAVLPGPAERIMPSCHTGLAQEIEDSGGVLVSEYSRTDFVSKPNFVARNRIVAGLSEVLVITEATIDSGTLHTARFALKQGLTVLAVPGDIHSPTSEGTNYLLKKGAKAVTEVKDILQAIKMPKRRYVKLAAVSRVTGSNPQEQLIIDLLEQGITQGGELLDRSGLTVPQLNHNLTMLEIDAKIRNLGSNNWALA